MVNYNSYYTQYIIYNMYNPQYTFSILKEYNYKNHMFS